MTAAVTIETARADNVVKVPNAALRFRPTDEVVDALGQKAPEPRQRPQGQSTRGAQGETVGPRRDRGEGGTQPAAVWVLEQSMLKRVPVEVGISDGTQTALVSGDVAAGTRVVTGTSTPAATTAPAPSGSPLLPAGRRGLGGRGGGG
jgi:HlyD family secretion protein